jgi:hypothetical protein
MACFQALLRILCLKRTVQRWTYEMLINRQQSMRRVSNEQIINNLFVYCTFYYSQSEFCFSRESPSPFSCKHKSERKVQYESLR